MKRYSYAGDREGMRALTLWQPWAWAVAAGHKRVENRKYAGPMWMEGRHFAIHAGKRFDDDSARALEAHGFEVPTAGVELGAVVAIARLRGTAISKKQIARALGDEQVPFFTGPYGWMLDIVVRAPEGKAIECRGWQGIWTLTPEVEAEAMSWCR